MTIINLTGLFVLCLTLFITLATMWDVFQFIGFRFSFSFSPWFNFNTCCWIVEDIHIFANPNQILFTLEQFSVKKWLRMCSFFFAVVRNVWRQKWLPTLSWPLANQKVFSIKSIFIVLDSINKPASFSCVESRDVFIFFWFFKQAMFVYNIFWFCQIKYYCLHYKCQACQF